MRGFDVEKEMYRRAVELIERRYPVGWGGAGVVHTANGHYFTSVSIDTANASAVLCVETVAVTTNDHALQFVQLGKLQPCHWTKAYPGHTLEQFTE